MRVLVTTYIIPPTETPCGLESDAPQCSHVQVPLHSGMVRANGTDPCVQYPGSEMRAGDTVPCECVCGVCVVCVWVCGWV